MIASTHSLQHHSRVPQSHSRPRNNPRQHGIALSGPTILVSARRGAADPTIDDDDLLEMKNRRRMAPRASSLSSSKLGGKNIQVDTDADLITKLKLAWRIFFPDKPKSLSPKEEGKKRLRMILVADRCGMSADSLAGMRESIVRAMQDFVEVEAEEAVEVNLSMDPEIGTIYSVAVPVKRVKPQMRPGLTEDAVTKNPTSSSQQWDPSNPDSDPSDQFPYGT